MGGEAVSWRCWAVHLCSVTFSVGGLSLWEGEGTLWEMEVAERWEMEGASASGGSAGGRLSSCSRSELASFTGERLDLKDLVCSKAKAAFFLAAFFSRRWSLRLSFPGFGRVGGGGRW